MRKPGLRLVLLTETFYPPLVDGIAIQNHQLAEQLAARGMDVWVITRQTEPSSAEFERIGRFQVTRVSPGGVWRGKGWKAARPMALFLARGLALLIRNVRRYDVVMVCGLKVLPALALIVKLLAGKRCIVQVQSPAEVWEDISASSLQKMGISEARWLLRGYRRMRKAVLRWMDAFVAVSPEIRRELVSIGVDPGKIEVIPNAVDTGRFHPVSSEERRRLRHQLALPADKTLFIFAGRLAASKGLPLLLKAWKEFARAHQGVHLLLVGSGRDSFDNCEPELKAFVKAHALEPSVSFTGDVRNTHEYLQASDVFVLPSEYEGFSLALGEALACGLPAIATRVGAASDLIRDGENGILIKPRDQEALLTAMERFLAQEKPWQEMAARIALNAAERYGVERVAGQYHRVISGLQPSIEAQKVADVIGVEP